MRYAGLVLNDVTAAPGLSITFYTQGCPHRCSGCHNPQTWDFDGGKQYTDEILNTILENLNKHNINRNFCLMGGEPLCPENSFLSYMLIKSIKDASPNTKIYVWTGYTYEQLKNMSNTRINNILELTDVLIDGPYISELRDITLQMRGSSNQNILYLH
jgi:anaerobic ribonucleoside-triphosphate reductase activating protein